MTARRVLALLVAGLLLAACSGDGPEAERTTTTRAVAEAPSGRGRVGPFTVLDGAATERGDLMTGIPIAPGSVLIGPTFPDVGDLRGGFEALLLVVGNPVAVYNHYLDYAAGLGMRAGSGGGCLYGFGSTTCARRVIDPADGEALSVYVQRRPVDGGYVSHAALHYEPPGTVDPHDAGPIATPTPTSVPPVVKLPAQVPAPSADRWSTLLAPNGPELATVEGTQLAGPPGLCPCGPTGWSAVLRVDRPVDAVIAAYARELGVTQPSIRPGRGAGGARVADLGLVPGGIVQLRTVTDRRGSWLLVAVSGG
ncbi:MAG: hypothetical protein JO291_04460 [Acidimicrobiia bacterium]|nr:hypothetical protein [Acidimicrobiia bacterium]